MSDHIDNILQGVTHFKIHGHTISIMLCFFLFSDFGHTTSRGSLINIKWPLEKNNFQHPIISDKDKQGLTFSEFFRRGEI